MDVARAKEIVDSPTMTDVNYFGVPVAIRQVDEATGTATIYPLDRTDEEQTVPLDALTEGESDGDILLI